MWRIRPIPTREISRSKEVDRPVYRAYHNDASFMSFGVDSMHGLDVFSAWTWLHELAFTSEQRGLQAN